MSAPSLPAVPPSPAEGAPLPSIGRAVARFPIWPRHFRADGVDVEHVPALDLLGDQRIGRMLAGREALAVEDLP